MLVHSLPSFLCSTQNLTGHFFFFGGPCCSCSKCLWCPQEFYNQCRYHLRPVSAHPDGPANASPTRDPPRGLRRLPLKGSGKGLIGALTGANGRLNGRSLLAPGNSIFYIKKFHGELTGALTGASTVALTGALRGAFGRSP